VSQSASPPTVLDIEAEQLGKIYARALLGAAQAAGSTESVLEELGEICDRGLRGHPELLAAFASPRVDMTEKSRIIDRLFGDASPVLVQLMKVMARRGRLGYLAAVRTSAVEQYDEFAGRVVAEVRTAVPLDDVLRTELTNQLAQKLGRTVRLREVVDERLIGGMVVRVGDTVFDSSVASRLDKLGRAAKAGFAHQLLTHSERFSSAT